jgi:hypothetical protein
MDSYNDQYQDIFNLKQLSLSMLQNEVLAIGVSNNYLMLSNKKNEIYRWIFNYEDSLKIPYTIPIPDKEKGYQSKFFCDQRSYHTIIKQNRYYYYFNSKTSKIKQLVKLNDVNVESVAWDETSGSEFGNSLLLGTDKGKIFNYQFEFDVKTDKIINEKLTELIQLKQERIIYGIAVSILFSFINLNFIIKFLF